MVYKYSLYTTAFPLRRKADVPTVLEPWLLARGGAQGHCGHRLYSNRGGEFASTRLEAFCQGEGIIQSYTLLDSPQLSGVAKRRIGFVMEVSYTSMYHAGSRGVATDYHVWGFLAHVRAPGTNKLSAPTHAYVFLGFPLDAYGWAFYDLVTHQFFASHDVTLDHPVPIVSVAADGEGTGTTGAGGASSKAAGGVVVEAPTVEDTAASSRWPRPASLPGFLSVPQFPPRSSLRPLASEPGGVPVGGTGGTERVVGGGCGSGGGAGAVSESRGGARPAAVREGTGGATPTATAATTLATAAATDALQLHQERVVEEPQPQQQSLSLSSWSRRARLSRAMSPEPRRSRYRADGRFHFVLRSRVPPLLTLPQPSESSLTIFFDLGIHAAPVPHLLLYAHEGDPDTLDIPIPRTYAEAISGHWASYWIAAEEAEMASYRSTGTYVDTVPPPRANVVSGMWLYKVKRPPGAPPVFKARYVARGFSHREGVDFFQTFAPSPKMITLRVLLHIAAQHDYELHSLDFSAAFLQGSLHEKIWLHCPSGFTGSFPVGTQWQLRRLVYGLRQAPCEWHDTLRTTLAALDLFPSSADPSHHAWNLSTRASPVASSSCEAEVYAVAMATQELRWLIFLLTDLGKRLRSPPVLFADNRSVVLLCEEPRLVGKAKHIQLRYFLLRELQ
ncbi:unnamed protein product [Closterium sp. NIES-53]